MDNPSFSSQPEELSAEDLAIIQAFDSMNDLMSAGNLDKQQDAIHPAAAWPENGAPTIENPEDMLMLFASEADEDISTMRRALLQLEQDNSTNSPGLVTLGRSAHKLKGTAGAMGCEAMSPIALKIKEEIQLILGKNTPLPSAQKQVPQSLVELQAAHTRLRNLEGVFSPVAFANASADEQTASSSDERPSSSLVARILHETFQRTGRQPQTRPQSAPLSARPQKLSPETALWDEMQMDRFTENRMLLQSFSESVADVATASAQLKAAFAQLNALIEQQVRQATMVRSDALRLRSSPFSGLVTRVQRIVQGPAQRYKRPIQLDASRETTWRNQGAIATGRWPGAGDSARPYRFY